MIYTNRREFLLASMRDKRQPWDDGSDEPEYFGLANTEHQFRKALCDYVFPLVRRYTARDIQNAMADELAALATK